MIFGERIRLRAMERTDLPAFVRWFNDPDVRDNLSMYLPLSSVEEEKWFEETMEKPAYEHPLTIEIQEDGNWVAIGNAGLFNFEWRNRSAELGISIGEKRYWNQGYGSETVGLLLRHGFQTLNLHRIFLRVFAYNQRGIRAYEKAGFVHEGTMRQSEFRRGVYQDILLMSILRNEWQG